MYVNGKWLHVGWEVKGETHYKRWPEDEAPNRKHATNHVREKLACIGLQMTITYIFCHHYKFKLLYLLSSDLEDLRK